MDKKLIAQQKKVARKTTIKRKDIHKMKNISKDIKKEDGSWVYRKDGRLYRSIDKKALVEGFFVSKGYEIID